MSKLKQTPNADLDPQAVKIGKWTFPPLTINTAILLERINSPFMRFEVDPETGKPKKVIPSIEEFARTLYVLIHAEDPRTNDIIADETKFRNCVSDLAKQISFRELATVSAALNELMAAADRAVSESDMEGDGKKAPPGRLS
jgi:hypothetical protein